MQSKHDAATNFIDAGNSFKKADPQGTISHSGRHLEVSIARDIFLVKSPMENARANFHACSTNGPIARSEFRSGETTCQCVV